MIRSVISISFESPYIILRRGFYTPVNLVSPLSLSVYFFLSLPSYLYLSLSPSLTPYLFFPVPYFLLSITYTPCISSVTSCLYFIYPISILLLPSLLLYLCPRLYLYISASAFFFFLHLPSWIFSFPFILSFLFFSSFLSFFYPFLRVSGLNYFYFYFYY